MSAAPGPSPGATTAFIWQAGDFPAEPVHVIERVGGAAARAGSDLYWIAPLGADLLDLDVYSVAHPSDLYILPNAPERSAS